MQKVAFVHLQLGTQTLHLLSVMIKLSGAGDTKSAARTVPLIVCTCACIHVCIQ